MPLEFPAVVDLRGPERRNGRRALLCRAVRVVDLEAVVTDRERIAASGRVVYRAAHSHRPGVLLVCRDQPESPRTRHRGDALVGAGIPDGPQPGTHLGTDAGGQQDLELARYGGVRRRCPSDAGRGRSHVPRALAAGEEVRRPLPLDNGRAEGCAPAPTGRAPLVRLAARGPMDEPLLHRGRVAQPVFRLRVNERPPTRTVASAASSKPAAPASTGG